MTQLRDPEVDRRLDDLVFRRQLPGELGTALGHLVHRRSLRHARAWLCGDYVSPEHKATLGVNPRHGPRRRRDRSAGGGQRARVAADLFNGGHNLLISSVQSGFIARLQKAVGGADLHRMSEGEAPLSPLKRSEAEALLRARMDAQPALAQLRRRRATRRVRYRKAGAR